MQTKGVSYVAFMSCIFTSILVITIKTTTYLFFHSSSADRSLKRKTSMHKKVQSKRRVRIISNADVFFAKADALFQNHCDRVIDNPHTPIALIHLGATAYRMKQYAQALHYYRAALTLKPQAAFFVFKSLLYSIT